MRAQASEGSFLIRLGLDFLVAKMLSQTILRNCCCHLSCPYPKTHGPKCFRVPTLRMINALCSFQDEIETVQRTCGPPKRIFHGSMPKFHGPSLIPRTFLYEVKLFGVHCRTVAPNSSNLANSNPSKALFFLFFSRSRVWCFFAFTLA